MKVKFNKKSFFILSKKSEAYPVVNITKLKTLDKRYEVSVEFGLNISECKKNDIKDFAFEVYNGELVENAKVLNIDMKNGLNSSVVDFENKKKNILIERENKLITNRNFSFISLVIGEIYKKSDVIYNFPYYEYYPGEESIEGLVTNKVLANNVYRKKLNDSYNFCLSKIRTKKDPALYKGMFPLKSIEKKAKSSTEKMEIGEWIETEDYGRYLIKNRQTEYYPVIFKFILNGSEIDSISEKLTFEIMSKTFEGKVFSIEKFTLNSGPIVTHIKNDIIEPIPTSKIYYRKLNKDVRGFGSSYNVINSSGLEAMYDLVSPAFTFRYQNSLLRYINGDKHEKTIFTTENNIFEAQSINLFDINQLPFCIIKNINLGSIQIKFENVPDGIVALGIQKRNVTLKESFRKTSNPEFVDKGSSKTFTDSILKNGHLYEYRPYYIDDKGHTKIASNVLQYQHKEIVDKIRMTISDLKREIIDESIGDDTRSYTTISFKISANLRKKNFESIKEFLEKNNYSLGSLGITEGNYQAYSDIFLYEVTRQNITTGEIEPLGVTFEEEFIDRTASLSNTKNVKPLNNFHNYRYFVRLGLRSPASLISTQVSENLNNGTVRNRVFNSYKLSQKNLLGDNVLPNTKTLNSVFGIEEDFMYHYTGLDATISSFVDFVYPKINNLKIETSLLGHNQLSWSVDGDVDYIDHFRIYASSDGIFCLIATVHPHAIGSAGTIKYFYRDSDMYGRLGKTTYTVAPILLNFNESPGKMSETIINNNNLPTFLR